MVPTGSGLLSAEQVDLRARFGPDAEIVEAETGLRALDQLVKSEDMRIVRAAKAG